jgi:hypothetical protein
LKLAIDLKSVFALLVMVCLHAAGARASLPDAPKAQNGKFRLNIECTFRYTTITNCQDFKTLFFSQESSLVEEVDSENDVDLILSLTDEQQADASHVGYTFSWTSNLPDAPGPISLPLILSTLLDTNSTLNALVQNGAKGLLVYCSIVNQNPGDNGQVVVVYSPDGSGGTPSGGWLNKLANSPWFFNIAGSGTLASSGKGANNEKLTNGSVAPEVAYFTDKYKVDLTASAAYTGEAVPSGTGGQISAHDLAESASGMVVYSVATNWSVAVINNTIKNTGANVKLHNDIDTGVEWTLVPFRTTQNRELAFRVGPEFTTLSLAQANDLGHLQEKYMSAFAQIYFYWVALGDKLTSSLSSTTTDDLQHSNYYKTTVTGTLGYQFNSVLGVTGSANYIFEPRSITYPANPNFTNPLQSTFLTDQPGGGYSYSVTLNIKLGNAIRKIRDRRWSTN